MARLILRVALNSPLRSLFDYLPPDNYSVKHFAPGQRLLVPFGKNTVRTGIIISLANTTEVPNHKLKKALVLLDEKSLFPTKHLKLIEWASHYYHHPIGDAVFTSIPSSLRKGKTAKIKQEVIWRLTAHGKTYRGELNPDELSRAKKQLAIFQFIKQHQDGVSQTCIQNKFENARSPLQELSAKNLIEKTTAAPEKSDETATYQNDNAWTLKPNKQQQNAIDKIIASSTAYQAFLLNGITGSGKTEVYLQLIRYILKSDKQVLVLIPEIGLTPQFIDRIKKRFGNNIAVLHSGLSEGKQLIAWLDARDGTASVVLGTRSAIWTPMPKLGMIIIDEEHDLSYKQQDGLRYSARDLALIRGQREKIPVVLGSATPSMESMKNAKDGRYQELLLSKRVSNAKLPDIQIHDVRNEKMYGAFSQYLLENIEQRLHSKQQTLLFLNRRGYAPVVMCHDCGFISQCPRCNVYMTFHKHKNKLHCHHCEHNERLPGVCPDCSGNQLIEVGHGTERLGETLTELFPDANIVRIDRDSTRRKGSMQKMLNEIHAGKADILIGTQMLAKGHHFPNVTLVGIVDADRGLFSLDYRASERMAQMLMQVSGRAGRGDTPGAVIVQTHYPEHPLLNKLALHDYEQFTQLLLEERQQTQLPPFSFQALIRTESNQQSVAIKFLNIARTRLQTLAQGKLEIYGPVSAPMEKRAGRYRLQLIIQVKNRQIMKKFLTPWIENLDQLPEARKVRWSVDVDPQDMI
jgi:primosomal protein N' (replication factor Y) (superfamily II helicase)